jgi:hypothetical protein
LVAACRKEISGGAGLTPSRLSVFLVAQHKRDEIGAYYSFETQKAFSGWKGL